ncbi:UDP-3-O-(3-hydroxymyristoyl)glucosamine N-acyltransferase [Crocinitomicaceae bacterium CZZ-1]|uniref:UDP-3-O-acylglucosamine N-acyltransferase n=1 Tax=Taishania pollutisoli TaxID=2766479 RepID=A0A8J6PHS6_9FLAO|nr:UDP-3-O-(3-hydroxymyristoyl)glucosamine N-acyltransferase [Taishania pollutisoli]MBC9811175.1 UDP-3-O-(3-hydroxymyristoyl)glucosamine N-acyltransferase [Taishania pollutisoli]MBX2947909.1 UDP-3-O-(3-hydroxymyristoyl)glucosamine N-acyltransferase [Crocinitomicaceae bacterium]NGF76725.1 UDP-3-O-(3-hydroxymyristoyl)glucosamine N-acyltransferase [Fluviicola sp. SGL-29]
MEFSAEQIAGIIQGEIVGNATVVVNGLAKIEEGSEGKLSFLSNPKYEEYIYTTGSSVCIVNHSFVPAKELPSTLTLIKVENAYACFAKLLEFYDQMKRKQPKIEANAYIAETASIGKDLYLGANAYISEGVVIGDNVVIYPNSFIGDNVKIGNNTIIYPNVSIYSDCQIGNNCVIHAGAVIGADGFGFSPDENGVFSKVPQIGIVIIEDNVDVGANATIDRATMGATIIRKGAKIDNLCQIAHNVEIGENSAMAAQVGIAGSAKIGKRVLIGGQAGISGHITIADGTMIVAQSGIPNSVKKPETLMGAPGIPIEDFKKSYFGFRKLPFILNKIQELEKKIKELTKAD